MTRMTMPVKLMLKMKKRISNLFFDEVVKNNSSNLDAVSEENFVKYSHFYMCKIYVSLFEFLHYLLPATRYNIHSPDLLLV